MPRKPWPNVSTMYPLDSQNVSIQGIVIYFDALDEILEIFFSIFDFQKSWLSEMEPFPSRSQRLSEVLLLGRSKYRLIRTAMFKNIIFSSFSGSWHCLWNLLFHFQPIELVYLNRFLKIIISYVTRCHQMSRDVIRLSQDVITWKLSNFIWYFIKNDYCKIIFNSIYRKWYRMEKVGQKWTVRKNQRSIHFTATHFRSWRSSFQQFDFIDPIYRTPIFGLAM